MAEGRTGLGYAVWDLNNEALPKAATGMVGARGDDDNGGVRDEVRGQERGISGSDAASFELSHVRLDKPSQPMGA
jgi:hypothetical protein